MQKIPISRNLSIAIRILPFAFIVHNAEETIGIAKWSQEIQFYHHSPVTTAQFAVAVLLLSALALIITFSKRLYSSEYLYFNVISGFSGLLFLNIFFPHLITTLFLCKYSPGLFTSLLIILPLSVYILSSFYRSGLMNLRQIGINSLIGGVIGISLVFVSLKLGELLT